MTCFISETGVSDNFPRPRGTDILYTRSIGLFLLYSFIYDNEVVREVPAIVVDDSHSSLSRETLRKVRRYA